MAHEPTAACWPIHCLTHNEDEPDAGAYRICGECRHVFYSPSELLEAHLRVDAELGFTHVPPPHPDNIYYCPHCTHNF